MTDHTDQKEKPHLFQPGQSGNPSGRPKGARSKLGEDFLKALADDFEKHGVKAVETVREERPHEYLKVVASLLPKHVEIKDAALEELGRDDLATVLAAVREAIAHRAAGSQGARH